MATSKQIAANRRNAQLSIGPKTDTGLARSSLNALKHGFCAEHVVMRFEKEEEFDQLLDGLRQELRPAGLVDEILLRQFGTTPPASHPPSSSSTSSAARWAAPSPA